jgi:competence protein ComEA
VPARVRGPAGTVAASAAVADDGPISLGTATVEQLDTIEGIGPVTAGDIIAYRDEHGGLSSVDELDQVTGIGPATMEALRDRLQP